MSGLNLPRPCRMHRLDLPRPYGMRRPALPRLGGMHLPELGLRVKALPAGGTRLPAGEQRAAAPELARAGPRVYLSLRRSLRCQDGPRVGAAPCLRVTAAAGTASPAAAAAVPAGLEWRGRGTERSPRGLCAGAASETAAGNQATGSGPAGCHGDRPLPERQPRGGDLSSGSDAAPPPGPCALLSSLSARSVGSAI